MAAYPVIEVDPRLQMSISLLAFCVLPAVRGPAMAKPKHAVQAERGVQRTY